jgi:hypothetical protein
MDRYAPPQHTWKCLELVPKFSDFSCNNSEVQKHTQSSQNLETSIRVHIHILTI